MRLRDLTERIRELRAPARRADRAGRRKLAHDERMAQKAAADAELRRVPANYPGGGGGGFGGDGGGG
jgi:hypothetical protein